MWAAVRWGPTSCDWQCGEPALRDYGLVVSCMIFFKPSINIFFRIVWIVKWTVTPLTWLVWHWTRSSSIYSMSYSDSLSWILEQLQRIRVKQFDFGLGTYVALLHTQHMLLCVLCRAVWCKRITNMFEKAITIQWFILNLLPPTCFNKLSLQ